MRERAFSQTTTSNSILSGSETVKLHFCFFCLPAVWYYWWSLVPRNEVEGVITQSDGYDSNHQAMCKKIYAWLWEFSRKQPPFPFVHLLPLSIRPSCCLFVCLFFTPRVHACIMCALLSMSFTLGGVFYVDILGTSSVFKILASGNTWPLSTLQEHIGACTTVTR